ncbi:LytR/AlgR family response regulator transcription factor [Elizabethkingia miricola]|uniref:LytR/AlgR family response regulator transcription factor n=1 Tax=Elizabethkingia miricola TaxID=172045 RepID=UPI000B360B0C|nr:LytTR family DNA-binding domain-containing protein [Elizabethkingia miricola]NHQ68421.1 response regulator transcription factor [Elizabethkingia miricola]NHQ72527.1 response regulator transcription factor [Elizabethkingia miricola]NHQ79508.1 response regulator transcription factor [Elizabethkingia miricola]PSL86743.1 DNA-binding response regulator [Elizabethkingia miricola]QHQ85843.1 response regulator transcription factor [Elizabethkingia miricola]
MKVLVIEDEIKTAKALGRMITAVQPEAIIVRYIQSVAMALEYLSGDEIPDVIFMDIQLADGNCFEIFSQVKVKVPVIFCTAFDEYAIEAFKSNGVDYILKPFEKKNIQSAFEKINNLKNFFQSSSSPDRKLEDILSNLTTVRGKTNFLVFSNNKYNNIHVDRIACFYSQFGSTVLVTFDQKEYTIPQSLDNLGQLVSGNRFFRINRQYLINFTAIVEVEHYFSRKLLVSLKVTTPEKTLVTKDKSSRFLQWLEER